MKANLYVTILGSYDIMIGIDWLESHEVILNYKMKQLKLVDDEGKRRMILGQNHGVSKFHLFLVATKEHAQGM